MNETAQGEKGPQDEPDEAALAAAAEQRKQTVALLNGRLLDLDEQREALGKLVEQVERATPLGKLYDKRIAHSERMESSMSYAELAVTEFVLTDFLANPEPFARAKEQGSLAPTVEKAYDRAKEVVGPPYRPNPALLKDLQTAIKEQLTAARAGTLPK